MSATMVSRRRTFGFRWSKKVEITLETKFLAKYFYQYFQIFSILIYNENLPVKSHLSNAHNTNIFFADKMFIYDA